LFPENNNYVEIDLSMLDNVSNIDIFIPIDARIYNDADLTSASTSIGVLDENKTFLALYQLTNNNNPIDLSYNHVVTVNQLVEDR